eukprot:g49717.t1
MWNDPDSSDSSESDTFKFLAHITNLGEFPLPKKGCLNRGHGNEAWEWARDVSRLLVQKDAESKARKKEALHLRSKIRKERKLALDVMEGPLTKFVLKDGTVSICTKEAKECRGAGVDAIFGSRTKRWTMVSFLCGSTCPLGKSEEEVYIEELNTKGFKALLQDFLFGIRSKPSFSASEAQDLLALLDVLYKNESFSQVAAQMPQGQSTDVSARILKILEARIRAMSDVSGRRL